MGIIAKEKKRFEEKNVNQEILCIARHVCSLFRPRTPYNEFYAEISGSPLDLKLFGCSDKCRGLTWHLTQSLSSKGVINKIAGRSERHVTNRKPMIHFSGRTYFE